MLSIILYIFIAAGAGYFIYIYWKKWSLIREDDLGSFKISFDGIKKLSNALVSSISPKTLSGLLKKIRIKKLLNILKKVNFRKTKKALLKIKNVSMSVLKKATRGLKKAVFNVKERIRALLLKKNSSESQEILDEPGAIESTPEEPREEMTEETNELADFLGEKIKEEYQPEIKEVKEKIKLSVKLAPAIQFAGRSLSKAGKLIKKSTNTTGKGLIFVSRKISKSFIEAIKEGRVVTKQIKTKIKIRAAVSVVKEFSKKINIERKARGEKRRTLRHLSADKAGAEDKTVKEALEEEKDTIVRPETYLGELLRKTEEDTTSQSEPETIYQKEAAAEELPSASSGQALEESPMEKVAEIIEETIESIEREAEETQKPIKKSLVRPKKTEDIVSKETLQKIEDDLISQIIDDSRNIEAYKKLGRLYYNQDRYDFAKESFEAAIKLGSGDQKIKDLLKDCESKIQN